MTQEIERRRAERRASDEELSPEYLAVLEVCGGEIRAADRAALAERRQAQAEAARTKGQDAKAVEATVPADRPAELAALPGPDRRRARSG